MSSLTTLAFKVKSIQAVDAAVKELGGTLSQQSKFQWHGRKSACSYAIKVPNTDWEIGLVKDGDEYKLTYDTWSHNGQALKSFMGDGAARFKHAYTKHLYLQEAKRKGYVVHEKKVGGKTVLRLTNV